MRNSVNYTISVSYHEDGKVKYFFNGRGEGKIEPSEVEIMDRLAPHIKGILEDSRGKEKYASTTLNVKVKHKR